MYPSQTISIYLMLAHTVSNKFSWHAFLVAKKILSFSASRRIEPFLTVKMHGIWRFWSIPNFLRVWCINQVHNLCHCSILDYSNIYIGLVSMTLDSKHSDFQPVPRANFSTLFTDGWAWVRLWANVFLIVVIAVFLCSSSSLA